MPRQYSLQYRERVVVPVQDGRDVRNLASEPGIAAATIYRWQRHARIDAGEIGEANSAVASGLAATKRRIRDLEAGPTSMKLAASMVKDVGIRGGDCSRLFKP